MRDTEICYQHELLELMFLLKKATRGRPRKNAIPPRFQFFNSPFDDSPGLSWPSHNVGEPELEEHPVWKRCCADYDCVPQQVKIGGKEGKEKISIEIEGIQTKVDKGKFQPVPSARTWVCYFNRSGEIANENIRCILYPEKSSTVNVPSPWTTLEGRV